MYCPFCAVDLDTDSGPAVGVFTGTTGSAAGQYGVRNGGRLVVRGVYHERSSDSVNGLRLTDRGTLSIDATRFSYATSEKAPLPDRGGVDDATIVRHLAALRATRPWVPAATAPGETDLRMYRVIASGGRGAIVELRAR